MEPEKKSNGSLVGLAIIIILLVIGGIYMWISNKNTAENTSVEKTETPAITGEDAAALDALEQDATSVDTSVGVDTDILK